MRHLLLEAADSYKSGVEFLVVRDHDGSGMIFTIPTSAY